MRRNQLTRLAAQLTTPLLPEDYLTLLDPKLTMSGYRAHLGSKNYETPESATFEFEVPADYPQHQAGQFLRLGVDVDGVRTWRSYSISSPAHTVGNPGKRKLAITVKRTTHGVVSRHLVNDAEVGDLVHLEAPAGDFVLPDVRTTSTNLVAFGSGITPIMAIIRTIAAKPHSDEMRVRLLLGARSEEEMIFRDELLALASQHQWLSVHLWPSAQRGRFNLGNHRLLDQTLPLWRTAPTFMSGPGDLLDQAHDVWERAGIADLLQTERFQIPRTYVDGGGGDVRFTASAKSATVDANTTLLDAGERAGVLMPSGCRMGICHTCVVPLKSGQVRDMRTGEVHGEPGDIIQTCVNAAACDVELQI